MSNNLYPTVPSAPEFEEENMQTKMYPPPGAPMQGTPYPPPAYSASVPQYATNQQQTNAPINAPTTTTATPSATTVVVVDSFPPQSFHMKCYHCNQDVKTKVKPAATCGTWLLCSLLCIIGCFCGCCLIPFCTNGTRDMLHYCPKCKKYLGIHERMRFGRRFHR